MDFVGMRQALSLNELDDYVEFKFNYLLFSDFF